MTAAALLAQLHEADISLSVRGDKLRVVSKSGAVSADLRVRLTKAKPQLIALLQSTEVETRARLKRLTDAERLANAGVHRLHADDVAACEGLPDETLLAYLHALERNTVMDAGIAPEGYTQTAHCDVCGPLWLWQGAPARLIACPWCFRRRAGKTLPRPQVRCGDCKHYSPDLLNVTAGVGSCGLGAGRARWPMQSHLCREHRPTEETPKQGFGLMVSYSVEAQP